MLAVKVVLSNGEVIYRLGLSKIFLMFEEHMRFFGFREKAAKNCWKCFQKHIQTIRQKLTLF
jgi:nicotinate-nucleotide pyrophosphorylase